ncbi:Myosin regulatory light chain cdc4 [Pseudocercospora fuligena]|uniref:Calmodulin n=1 Tax=Pseudocercospora fuligena TaxID=685502 RepID=A0A8H6RY73_9PEZI|nr:Myosin regulatory light chain cdc4 [Pseudocercospora fuligena]
MADQAQSTNFKEAFSLFDKRGQGRVQLDSLGDLLRACGQNPTLAEIKDLEHQVFDKDLTGFIGVGQFRYILTNLGEKMSDDEVDELLKAVDTSSGEINYMDMVKMILQN